MHPRDTLAAVLAALGDPAEQLVRHLSPHLGPYVEVQVALPARVAISVGDRDDGFQHACQALWREVLPPEIAALVDAWRDDVVAAGGALGVKWPIHRPPTELQLYAEGSFAPAHDLTLARLGPIGMLGLEFGDPLRHVAYAAIDVSPPRRAEVIRQLEGAVAARLAGTPWPERFPAIVDTLIPAREQKLFVTLELRRPPPADLKIDLGTVYLGELDAIAAAVSIDPAALAPARELLTRVGAARLSHVGVRLVPDGTARLSLYARDLAPGRFAPPAWRS